MEEGSVPGLEGLLAQMEALLDTRLDAIRGEVLAARAELATAKALRIALMSKVEALEREHNAAVQTASKLAEEYERMAKYAARARDALAYRQPTMPIVPPSAVRAVRDVPHLRQSLIANAAAISRDAPIIGVYFLLNGTEVVYVGQSVNIIQRVLTHSLEGVKQFDRWCYTESTRTELDDLERFYIRLLAPMYNVAHKTAPRTELEVM